MSDLPRAIRINEEGPREGFQFEKGPIETAKKIALIDRLSWTGLKQIQTVSFVPPQNVPGMADADDVVAGITPNPAVVTRNGPLNKISRLSARSSGCIGSMAFRCAGPA